ncbi:hypothetical protein [Streptomyces mexicanus]|uniref:hypothetical protein n=1 Tax=Streptomyces mexicanus TaxID=178566 RepID=UPI0036511EA1
MRLRKRTATGLVSVALVAGAIGLAPAASAVQRDAAPTSATSCYGSAHSYSKPSGTHYYPTSGYLTATSNCADINIKPSSGRWVAVCWYKYGTCQSSWTWAAAGVWTTVATDVVDGTQFIFDFDSTSSSTGSWAA